jgi:membrane-associated HD superfamily phosphohydrolase
MSELPNISQNNEQILNDIQTLQQMEQQLFNNLETNTHLLPEQQQQIIEKMNQLSNMRINLYQTMSGVNDFFQNALSSSVGTLKEQTIAIGIVESELNKSKKRLELLESEKNNKIRLVEINDYYGDKYAEHSQLMKIIIFTLLPVIILAILNNKNILPNSIYYVLVIIISIIGGYYFWRRYASIIMRDNMDYQKYNWFLNTNDSKTGPANTNFKDPWLSATMPGTCIGENCCSENQEWDNTLNKCLTKTQTNKYKTDYKMGEDYKPKNFVN